MTTTVNHRSITRTLMALALTLAIAAPAWAGPPLGPTKLKSGPGRFKVLAAYGDEAVLDKETGLVWQRTENPTIEWTYAIGGCFARQIGGRYGWRLPTIDELATLVDASELSGLPDGHPFELEPGGSFYWSQTSAAGYPDLVYVVTFASNPPVYEVAKDNGRRRSLCVRAFGGGSGFYETY